ncbi:MAG TPA: hypothetical protein ENJ95_04740 [Bacteroidetes bacterium]|nr:hypothetical protein [Bacteroidota bacterium]
MIKNILNSARTNIAKSELETAISEMLIYLKGSPRHSDLIIISQNYHSLQKEKTKGLLTYEQGNIQKNRIANSLLELINQLDKEATEGYLNNLEKPKNNISTIEDLLDILSVTGEAFVAQAKIRNLLVANMCSRLNIKNRLEYEVFFSTYFPKMNSEERRLHNTIRSYTENILSKYNQKALDLINENKSIKKEIPKLKDLELHLIIWMGKYSGVFQDTPSMSLVYVGVEEGVPFPRGIEGELKLYLQK